MKMVFIDPQGKKIGFGFFSRQGKRVIAWCAKHILRRKDSRKIIFASSLAKIEGDKIIIRFK